MIRERWSNITKTNRSGQSHWRGVTKTEDLVSILMTMASTQMTGCETGRPGGEVEYKSGSLLEAIVPASDGNLAPGNDL
eukprot:2643024-Rhodomonas_salina.1